MASDQDYRALLEVARIWRSALIPKTSTATLGPTRALLEGIAKFDPIPCRHPRDWRIFHPTPDELIGPSTEHCGYCGQELPPPTIVDTKPL